jgi:hypothetical protein
MLLAPFTITTLIFGVAIRAANIMFIRIPVTFDAVVKIANAFLDVLAPDIVRGVFMATKAGVGAVVVADMAGDATVVVIAIKLEMFVVIKSRWRPFVLLVALAAVATDLLVQGICRRLVTRLALIPCRLLQQGMIEMSLLAETFDAGVITVTGGAILIDQFLMKGAGGQRFADGLAFGRQTANVGRFVANHAAHGIGSGKGGMAGKAIGFKPGMAGNQLARTNHQVRINKSQYRQQHQVGRENKLDGAAHDHPQNKKMLTM